MGGVKRPSPRGGKPVREIGISPMDHFPQATREWWAEHFRYQAAAYHKRNPANYGLPQGPDPRPDKTWCDLDRIVYKEEAVSLVRDGLCLGLVSPSLDGEWPRRVWAVGPDRQVYEAQLTNKELGTYHGYPLRQADDSVDLVLEAWDGRQP